MVYNVVVLLEIPNCIADHSHHGAHFYAWGKSRNLPMSLVHENMSNCILGLYFYRSCFHDFFIFKIPHLSCLHSKVGEKDSWLLQQAQEASRFYAIERKTLLLAAIISDTWNIRIERISGSVLYMYGKVLTFWAHLSRSHNITLSIKYRNRFLSNIHSRHFTLGMYSNSYESFFIKS